MRHSFVVSTTILTCVALQADHNDQSANKTEKFIQKAAMGGQIEVEMGQLAQQKGQAQEVKSLGATLVRDHTQANQKLEQLAQTKNVQLHKHDTTAAGTAATDTGKAVKRDYAKGEKGEHVKGEAEHAKHHAMLNKLRNSSGAEFDKEFVKMAIKDHKKDIAEFEKCRVDPSDKDVTAFIDETLPTLRNHLQMAQSAARVVGVDESTIATDRDDDSSTTAVGAPATGTRGSDKPSSPASNPDRDKERSALEQTQEQLNAASDTDASGTIHQNTPSATVDANLGDRQVTAIADVDASDRSASSEANIEKKHKVFQKGDGKVLGLSTDKHDGKLWGIFPNPRANKNNSKDHDAEIRFDRNIDQSAVGSPATTESGSKSDQK